MKDTPFAVEDVMQLLLLPRVCPITVVFCCFPSQAQSPVLPWPPAYILQRQAEANCKVDEILVEKEGEAKADAERIATTKQGEIDEKKGIADNALEKRKDGDYRIETGIKRTGFALDLPEITFSFKETRIPTVHVKVAVAEILLLVPGQCAVGKWDVPEFKGLSITMRTQTIYLPCPVQKKAKLSLPQFTAGETTMKLPQITVKMVRKDVSFHVPQFTYRDWEKVEKDAEHKMEVEKELLARALQELKQKKAGVTAEAIRLALKTLNEEAEQELQKSELASLVDVDSAHNELVRLSNEAYEALVRAGADPQAQLPFSDVEKDFAAYRNRVRQPYEDARAQLNDLFDGLVRRYLGAVIGEVGSAPFCGTLSTPSPSLSQ